MKLCVVTAAHNIYEVDKSGIAKLADIIVILID
jgi:hypothetical protein